MASHHETELTQASRDSPLATRKGRRPHRAMPRLVVPVGCADDGLRVVLPTVVHEEIGAGWVEAVAREKGNLAEPIIFLDRSLHASGRDVVESHGSVGQSRSGSRPQPASRALDPTS
jgi:hypothetical protein